jgi:hypothetical protein
MEKKRKFQTAALMRRRVGQPRRRAPRAEDFIYMWEVIQESAHLTVEEAEKYCRETLAMRDEQVSVEFGMIYVCSEVMAVSDDGVVIKVVRRK